MKKNSITLNYKHGAKTLTIVPGITLLTTSVDYKLEIDPEKYSIQLPTGESMSGLYNRNYKHISTTAKVITLIVDGKTYTIM